MPLSTLQSRIARTLTALPEARDFALAGGGALVTLGIVERPTEDLDYFATAPDAVDRLRPVLERALVDAGLDVAVRRAVPGFAQLLISDGTSTTALDLAWDARLDPPHIKPRLRQLVDNTDELAHCCVVVIAGPELTADANRGIDAYQALKLRIADDVRDRSRDNPYSSLIRVGAA